MKTPFSRRRFLKTSTPRRRRRSKLPELLKLGTANAAPDSAETIRNVAAPGDVSVRLLDGKALTVDPGVSFGVPWPQGSIKRNATFRLTSEGRQLAATVMAVGVLAGRLTQVERLCHGRTALDSATL